MTPWIETCRGTVPPWECDVTEHFTIAYYFDRMEQAAAKSASLFGLAERLAAGVLPRRFDVRFTRELRAGASFHIESAGLGVEETPRFVHRVVDSGNGEPVTWVEEGWGVPVEAAARRAIEARIAAWEGPVIERRPEPAAHSRFVPTGYGRVRPVDLDETGIFSLTALVHRFTDACIQAQAAIGLTGDYMETERRGYSTFELGLAICGALRLGEPYRVVTGIAHLGNTSMRLAHRLSNPQSGAEIARLSQFGVNLDLDARRPAPLPEPIRARAAALLVPPG